MITINIKKQNPETVDVFIKWTLPLDVVTEYLLKKAIR